MQNIKNHNIYTDNFILHVIDLNSIHLATKDDLYYEIDKWASFFKAKNWEDIRMLVNENPDLQSVAKTLYQLNMNEQLRETCDRFIRAEARENAIKCQTTELKQINSKLKQENTELEQANADLEQANADLEQANSKLKQTNTELCQSLADKDTEIARLNALLESLNNQHK